MKRFAYLLVIGALSMSVSSAYGITQGKEHGGMKTLALNDRIIDSISGKIVGNPSNIEDPHLTLETINIAQHVDGPNRVYQSSTVGQAYVGNSQLGNQLQQVDLVGRFVNQSVDRALQNHDPARAVLVDRQLE